MNIVQQIKEERRKQGYTLMQLAEMIGTSHSRLSDIENGKANPSLDVLQRIASALGCKITLIKDSE